MTDAEKLVRSSREVASVIRVPGLDNKVLRFDADVNDESKIATFAKALDSFFKLDRKHLKDAVERYLAVEYDYYTRENGLIADPEINLWESLEFQDLNLVGRSDVIYVQLVAESSWGHAPIQIIFKNGTDLSRLSEEDGHYACCDAYGLEEAEDRISDLVENFE